MGGTQSIYYSSILNFKLSIRMMKKDLSNDLLK